MTFWVAELLRDAVPRSAGAYKLLGRSRMVKPQTSVSGGLRLRSDAQDAPEPGAEKKVPAPVAAFKGTIAPTRVTVMYQVGLALVALVMLLLVVIYFGLIACVGYGVYWHLRH